MKKMLKSLVLGTLIGISNIGINRCMSESLDMNITGNINGLFSTLEIKVVSDSSEGIDNYDNILSENFNTQFYSGVNGEKLSRDVFPNTPRDIYSVFSLDTLQQGNLNFSWSEITKGYDGVFTYYGNDSSYSIAIGSLDMKLNSSYFVNINDANVYSRITITDSSFTIPEPCSSILLVTGLSSLVLGYKLLGRK